MGNNFNFDEIVDRKNTNCIKWDYYKKFTGVKKDLLPMWVADMDFKSPPAVIDALKKRAEHGIYGYSAKPDSYYDTIINWVKKRYTWEIEKEWIVYTPGIVTAINFAIEAFTDPEDGIIVQKPVYFPFFNSIENHGRTVINNELKINEDKKKYEIDFKDLEAKINNETKMMLFCSPHNPVGRVWKKDELKKLEQIAIKNDILVFSDEIHADLILNDNKHIPFASLSKKISKKSITGISPSKTFNIAGLYASAIIIPNNDIREKFKNVVNKFQLYHTNCFAIEAVEAAYRHGEEWLEELLEYLEKNLELTKNIILDIPNVDLIEPEGTFLVWLDFRSLKISHQELRNIIENKANLLLNDGKMFGEGGSMFMRLNIATPYKRLKNALMNLKKALN